VEQLTLVCDVDGRPAVRSVTLKVDGANWVIDLCEEDTRKLLNNARKPRRGRKAATVLAPAPGTRRRPGRPKGSTTKTTAKTGRRKATNGRRKTALGRRKTRTV
jgi:hypothetical protein